MKLQTGKGYRWYPFLLLCLACSKHTASVDDDAAIRAVLISDFHHALAQMGPIDHYVETRDSVIADEMVLHLSPRKYEADRRHAIVRIRVTCGAGCGSVEDAYVARTGDKWIVARRKRLVAPMR